MAALAPGSRPLPEAPLGELLENGSVLHYLARVVQALLRKGGRRESLPTLKLRSSGLGARSKTFADKADVDFFLRVCRDVGLTDVDLFTTSAVCGEASARDILRVCRSLRTLSVRLEDLRPGVFPPFSAGSRAAGMSTESTGKKASVFSGLGKPGTPGERAPAAAGATGSQRARGRGGGRRPGRCWARQRSWGRPCLPCSPWGGSRGGWTSASPGTARREPGGRGGAAKRSGGL